MLIGELAAKAGVSIQTLRYYERRGLVTAPARTSGGYRAYNMDAVRIVRFVKRAQQLGFTLDEIAELLHLANGGPQSCDSTRTLAEGRMSDVEARIADLERMRDSLGRLVATCLLPHGERECPLVEAIEADSEVVR